MGAESPFLLGRWRVEPTLNRLVDRDGAIGTRQVEPKVMSVLVVLASAPGEVFSRDELLDAVWQTEYVSEEIVRRAIYELRKALGDDAGDPTFVETVPSAGYRLIAPITSCEGERFGADHRVRRGRRGWHWAMVLVAIAAGASIVVWWSGSGTGKGNPLRLTPLTSSPGLEYDPALAPDGTRVAFLRADEDGSGRRLIVRLVAEESEIELASLDHGGGDPTWSPTGSRVAFARRELRNEEPAWSIVSLPALGGDERRIVDLGTRRPYGLDWSPDGQRLAFGWSESDGIPYALYTVTVQAPVPRRLTDPPAAISGDGAPAWSPDGNRIAFLRNHVGPVQDVFVVDSAGGSARRVTPASRKIYDVDWAPNGADLLVTVYEAGDHRLAFLPLEGGSSPRLVSGAGEGAQGLSVGASRDGRSRVVYSRYEWRFDFWRFDRIDSSSSGARDDRRGAPKGERPRRMRGLASTRFDSELCVSDDGEKIAFTSSRSGSFEIWVSDLGPEDSGARRLTDFGGPWTGQPAWSPDGRWIAFGSAAGGDVDVWLVDPRGGLPRRLTDSTALDLAPSWSRDGERIYFASNRGGSWEVWSRKAEADEPPHRVTSRGGFLGRESPDGGWLWFTRRGEDGLWRMALPDGDPELVVKALDRRSWGNWTPTPEGVLFVAKTPDHLTAVFEWTEASGVDEVAKLTGWPLNPSLAAGPGARWLLWSQTEPGAVDSDLMLVDGI